MLCCLSETIVFNREGANSNGGKTTCRVLSRSLQVTPAGLCSFSLVTNAANEATKQAKLMEFTGQKYVAKHKISRQSPKQMSLRKYSMSLHGPTFTEMLSGDIF